MINVEIIHVFFQGACSNYPRVASTACSYGETQQTPSNMVVVELCCNHPTTNLPYGVQSSQVFLR